MQEYMYTCIKECKNTGIHVYMYTLHNLRKKFDWQKFHKVRLVTEL